MTLVELATNAGYVLGLLALGLLFLILGQGIYNVYFHPARHFPGPRLWAAYHIFKDIICATGDIDLRLCELHAQYGPVVRISPDELSFRDEQAWKDIYAHPNYLAKWPRFAFVHDKPDTPADIINSTHADHARIRRQLSHAFSEKALREQEDRISSHISLLMDKITDAASTGSPVDMVKWYNLTTFDVISDLAFGQSFDSLIEGEYHPWVASVFNNIRTFNIIRCFATYPGAKIIIGLLASADLRSSRQRHKEYTVSTVRSRLAKGTMEERRDFLSYTLKHKDEGGMTEGEIIRTASTLIMAGSETTATLLSGVTYFLGRNPEALRKVVAEVRNAFRSESEITFLNAAGRLPYMLACLDETLRLYPPAPFISPRLTPAGITKIAGYDVPGGMGVGVARLAAARDPQSFFQADRFCPERWLESAREEGSPFYHDARGCFQSFLVGPGACLGRNLAYYEMRTILARILWRFDLRLSDESQEWVHGQKTYVVWEKPPLMCYLDRSNK
ncbi:hypothetical protein ASPWEDRAFT_52761 [Aspergillus wentii DTO 134E9]|uniref:Cytochrome P450 monooxygenase n=1 Tax=Aspergillus wentii DTO 134E9 TaxID=1073089 RepID=A0A1L9RI28_ASPWE|nr:uncharacterized protein ASPWEDRAFT_52761 [Aspergillus wentii DTO 134E9]KAI9925903.1 hypothetical protein MW887_005709 [Aspergillus wentii]OJJ34586.1 hypothetical protein ASPWEDRAFT_52761 [Aspergillus wentii DTO 134E9]